MHKILTPSPLKSTCLPASSWWRRPSQRLHPNDCATAAQGMAIALAPPTGSHRGLTSPGAAWRSYRQSDFDATK